MAYMRAQVPFFKTRIQSLLDKDKLGPEVREKSVPFAARLYMGEKMVQAPDVWIASELLVMKDDGCQKLVCPAAEKALLSVFDSSTVICDAITIFRNDPSMRWRCLELAVVYLFRHAGGVPLTLCYTDLCGNNEDEMILGAKFVVYGGKDSPREDSIPRDTVFVCTPNPSVVDLLIHDASGAQILMQVSESCYRNHTGMYEPNDPRVQQYVASVHEPSVGVQLQYVYLTTNTSVMNNNEMKRTTHYRDDVLLVAGYNMERFFGYDICRMLL